MSQSTYSAHYYISHGLASCCNNQDCTVSHSSFTCIRDFPSFSSAHYLIPLPFNTFISHSQHNHSSLFFYFRIPCLYLVLTLLPLFSLPPLQLSVSPPHPLFSPASCKITPCHLSVCLCMYRSHCVCACVCLCCGECLREWPCECACATLTRWDVVWTRRQEGGGGGLDMAMWMMFWHWDCSWPTGERVWRAVCLCVRERWDPLWAESKQPREGKEKQKKLGRPDSIVRYPTCSHHLFNLWVHYIWFKHTFPFLSDSLTAYVYTFFSLTLNDPSLSTCLSSFPVFLSLAFSLSLCSAACWLCEELVQCCLKPWQNANVSPCTGSVLLTKGLHQCLFVCVFVCVYACASLCGQGYCLFLTFASLSK